MFYFTGPAATRISTLSLHDALPILHEVGELEGTFEGARRDAAVQHFGLVLAVLDRKSTRLNSSHVSISYAVFCLKKKNNLRFGNRRNVMEPLLCEVFDLLAPDHNPI